MGILRTTLLAAMLSGTTPLSSPIMAQTSAPDFSRFAASPRPAAQPQTGLRIIPLTVHPVRGPPRQYQVEVAQTPTQQAIGMMYRRSVPPGTGMLFPMNAPRETAFWMRNTFVPLDIIFIGANQRIIRISANTPPLSDDPVPSGGPAIAVLELAGGEAKRIGLHAGDAVQWKLPL